MSPTHLLETYGYAAVVILVMAESVGIPLPGETIVVAAGVYAGTAHRLSVWSLFAVVSAAAIVRDNIGFWLGRAGGYALLRRFGRRFGVDEARSKSGATCLTVMESPQPAPHSFSRRGPAPTARAGALVRSGGPDHPHDCIVRTDQSVYQSAGGIGSVPLPARSDDAARSPAASLPEPPPHCVTV
jgi:hypothetical protein